jgi:Protein of unknown function (DUF1549)
VLRLFVCLSLFAALGICQPAIPRNNYIDDYVLGKMAKEGVRPAPLSSDAEFLRRVYLDLTGRLPEPSTVRKFLADQDQQKRDKIIDSLFPPLPEVGLGRRETRVGPFFDRWSYYFCDLFRANDQLRDGVTPFHRYIYEALELNLPYDRFVRDLITASGLSTWTTGAANFVARERVMAGDGYSEQNHEDTCDELYYVMKTAAGKL